MIRRGAHGKLLFLLLMMLAPQPALAQPADDLRFDIERIAVVVQVYDADARMQMDRGSGFVIADDGETLTLLTAEHVVAAVRDDDALIVRVLFHGTRRWVDAELGEPLAAGSGRALDAAILSVPRDWAPIADRKPIAQLMHSPSSTPGDPLWVFALDLNTGYLRWRAATAGRSEGHLLAFDGAAIHPGCSGAVILSNTGPIGLVTQAGPGGRNHRAVRLDSVIEQLAPRKLVVIVKTDPLTDALRNAFDNRLGIAVFAMAAADRRSDGFTWGAIELTAQIADGYAGSFICTGGASSCRFRLTEGEWTLELEQSVRILPNPRVELRAPMMLSHESGVAIPGMVIIRAPVDVGDVLLAVPHRNTEMLASRVLLSNRSGSGLRLEDPTNDAIFADGNRDRRVKGRTPYFALDFTEKTAIQFSLDAQQVGTGEVRLAGEIVEVDAIHSWTQGHDISMVENWRAVRLVLQPVGGASSDSVSIPMSQRTPFTFAFPPHVGLFRLHHPNLKSPGGTTVPRASAPLLINARLIYAD